jgi:glycerol-3-phosphate acyltransferase PlsY
LTIYILQFGLIFGVAYVIGSLPTAYLLGRVLKGIDLREYGSGNVGASNAAVYLGGRKTLISVGVIDMLKGLLIVGGVGLLDTGWAEQIVAGLAAVTGHNWSLYLRFTGGRGMATAAGALLAMGLPFLVAFVLLLSAVGLFRREVSLWMGLGVLLMPIVSLSLSYPTPAAGFSVGIVILLAVKRLLGNRQSLPIENSIWEILKNRLLYDRDIRNRERWISRAPSTDNS